MTDDSILICASDPEQDRAPVGRLLLAVCLGHDYVFAGATIGVEGVFFRSEYEDTGAPVIDAFFWCLRASRNAGAQSRARISQ